MDLGESIQNAVDTAADTNGDGYIIIGVIANATGALGGHTSQTVVINRAYALPFALIGCSVTLHDPNRGDGQPTARIATSASSPMTPNNPARSSSWISMPMTAMPRAVDGDSPRPDATMRAT